MGRVGQVRNGVFSTSGALYSRIFQGPSHCTGSLHHIVRSPSLRVAAIGIRGPEDHAQFAVAVPQLNSDLPVEREESVQLLALASLRFTQVGHCPRLMCKCALLIL